MGMHKKYGTNGALTFFSIGMDSSQKLQNANAITRKDWGPVLFLFAAVRLSSSPPFFWQKPLLNALRGGFSCFEGPKKCTKNAPKCAKILFG